MRGQAQHQSEIRKDHVPRWTECETLAPILAGDSLTSATCLRDVYPKTGRSGTMVFLVWETTFTNQRGDKVAEVRESHVAKE